MGTVLGDDTPLPPLMPSEEDSEINGEGGRASRGSFSPPFFPRLFSNRLVILQSRKGETRENTETFAVRKRGEGRGVEVEEGKGERGAVGGTLATTPLP